MESQFPGSFQRNVDEMFKLNGLPLVKFPQNIVTKKLQNLINDASCSAKPKENPQSQIKVKIKVKQKQKK